MEFTQLPSSRVAVSNYPVLRSYYSKNRGEGNLTKAGATPVTEVSASEASAFAAELGARLPEYDEIAEFFDVVKRGDNPLPRRSSSIEWLNCSPDWARESQKMRCFAAVDTASKRLGLRGAMEDRRSRFVTFRIVRPQ